MYKSHFLSFGSSVTSLSLCKCKRSKRLCQYYLVPCTLLCSKNGISILQVGSKLPKWKVVDSAPFLQLSNAMNHNKRHTMIRYGYTDMLFILRYYFYRIITKGETYSYYITIQKIQINGHYLCIHVNIIKILIWTLLTS